MGQGGTLSFKALTKRPDVYLVEACPFALPLLPCAVCFGGAGGGGGGDE